MNCNFCGTELKHVFCDLGYQPPSNSFLNNLLEPETYYPLTAYVCEKCFLVQVPEVKRADEIFKEDYPYFSSQSPANVSHAKEYCDMMMERFRLGFPTGTLPRPKRVLEIGSNDGYMLQWFKEKGCEVLGVDPAEEPSMAARGKGIYTMIDFFGVDFLTRPYIKSHIGDGFDLICGINVLNHQPDINDFVKGLKMALAPKGVITFEFPHLLRTVEGLQFDQIYHEHYSYFSLGTIDTIFYEHGLEIFDVDQIPEHGGSLRIYARHLLSSVIPRSGKMIALFQEESKAGMNKIYTYSFNKQVEALKEEFVEFLLNVKDLDFKVVAYGAAAKGNTFLNYCGIKADLIPYIVDKSPHKQGKYLPGSHIPVVSEEIIKKIKPDYVLILAWNLKDEIATQLSYIKDWDGEFVVAIPSVEVF